MLVTTYNDLAFAGNCTRYKHVVIWIFANINVIAMCIYSFRVNGDELKDFGDIDGREFERYFMCN
jgi:hypothetical protein